MSAQHNTGNTGEPHGSNLIHLDMYEQDMLRMNVSTGEDFECDTFAGWSEYLRNCYSTGIFSQPSLKFTENKENENMKMSC